MELIGWGSVSVDFCGLANLHCLHRRYYPAMGKLHWHLEYFATITFIECFATMTGCYLRIFFEMILYAFYLHAAVDRFGTPSTRQSVHSFLTFASAWPRLGDEKQTHTCGLGCERAGPAQRSRHDCFVPFDRKVGSDINGSFRCRLIRILTKRGTVQFRVSLVILTWLVLRQSEQLWFLSISPTETECPSVSESLHSSNLWKGVATQLCSLLIIQVRNSS